MGFRLEGFDYTRPYFYMVTMRRLEGLSALSAIVAPGRCEMSAITKAFVHVIRGFHEQVAGLCPIECFSVMPDHIHLLIKLAGEGGGGSKTLSFRGEGGGESKTLSCRSEGGGERKTLSFRSEGGGERKMLSFRSEAGKTFSFRSAGKTLGSYVAGLMAALSRAYWEVCAKAGEEKAKRVVEMARGETKSFAPVFFADWHDWIVKCEGQLPTFTRYIRENPARSWLRRSRPEYFRRVSEIDFLGRKWHGYGNAALLKLPVLAAFKCSRKWAEGGEEWSRAVAAASRIGPGGAGVSTFMSPCEKACGHAIGLAGGRWIVLSPEGFGERWHPGRQYEKFCAEGRMLFLSLYEATAREPTRAELYERCHEMGDIVAQGLKGGADE